MGMSPVLKKRSIIVLRWLVFAPAAITGAAIAHQVIILLTRWSFSFNGIDPDSFLVSTWTLFISTSTYTSVLVYLSAYIAPHGKKAVSIVVATLASACAVFLFVMSLINKNYESTFYSICFAAGACINSFSIVHGDTKMPPELDWSSEAEPNR